MPRSRRVANQCAVDLLANKEAIADDDVLQVLRLWLFKQNKNRQNVLPLGATSVHSDTLGLVRSRMGKVVATRFTKKYPAVFMLFSRWLAENLPEQFKTLFSFTSISCNFAYAARLHRVELSIVGGSIYISIPQVLRFYRGCE